MTKGLHRYYGNRNLHFMTCSCYRRQPHLGTAIRRSAIVTRDKKFVLDEIEAKYHLALGDVDVAAEHAKKALDYHRNGFTLSLTAKVEMARSARAATSGMTVMAESHRNSAIGLVKEALQKEPKNLVLINQLKSLTSIGH